MASFCLRATNNYLRESTQKVGLHHGVWAFELPDDVKALIELREHVHNGGGEEGVFGRLLEAISLVALVSAMQILHRYFVVLIEPLHHKGFEPPVRRG